MDFEKLQSKASKWMKIADAMAWYLIKRFAKREIILNMLTFFLIVFIDLQTCITNVININNNYK